MDFPAVSDDNITSDRRKKTAAEMFEPTGCDILLNKTNTVRLYQRVSGICANVLLFCPRGGAPPQTVESPGSWLSTGAWGGDNRHVLTNTRMGLDTWNRH